MEKFPDKESFDKIVERKTRMLAETLKKKNSDYGSSAFETAEKYGDISFLIRMEDKMNRLRMLSKRGSSEVDESLCDTLLDLAGYAILMNIFKSQNAKSEDLSQVVLTRNPLLT